MKKNALQNFVRRGGYTLFLLVIMALLAPARMWGQTELTVYSGSATNAYVPIIGSIDSRWQKTEFVIPSSSLTAMEGKVITQMKFRHSYPYYVDRHSCYKVFMKEVDFEAFGENAAYQGDVDATIVYEGQLWPREYYLIVEFDNFYLYQGGNLLIGFYTTQTGGNNNYQYSYYGQVVTGGSISALADDPDNIQATQRNFIPQTTFTYYDEDYCFAPKNLLYDGTTITSTSVELDWTPLGNEQEWKIKCSVWDPNEEEYIESIVDGITEHPYTLSGLEPATNYSVTVAADCGNDNTSDWSSSIEFMTNCPEYATVPLNESFENEFPVCWSIYGSGYYNNYVYTTSYYESYDGYNSLMFNLQDVNSAYYAILPAIANLDECQISFYAMVPEDWYSTGAFSVGVMTDPTDPSTFVTIKTFESTYEWMEYKAYFDHYTGNGAHIAIKMDASYHGILLVDEVSVEPIEANTCFEIDALVPTYVGMNSAEVSWTAHANESSWQMQYKTEDEEWPEESILVATSSQTLENLEPNVKYDIRVRAYCSAESQSEWTQTSFTTPFCDPENQCDIHYVLRTSESWGWDGNSIDVYNEDEALVGSLTVENGSWKEGDLYLCDGSTYSFVLRIDYPWALEYLSFDIYGPDGNLIEGLSYSEGTMPTGDDGDEITLLSGYEMVCPDCRRPRNLTVDDITSSSAVMTWQAGGSETAWVLQYSADQSTWQDVQVNTNPTYTLQNLEGNKVYYVRVLAHCGGNDYSIPSNIYSFRTDCPEYQSIPYSEDFNSYEPFDPYAGGGGEWKGSRTVSSDRLPFCWSSLNSSEDYQQSMYPYIDYDWESESNVLKFYEYCYSNSDQYAILPQMQNVSDLQLSFNAKLGESYFEENENAPFSIGVMTDPTDAESFIEIQSIETTEDWNNNIVYFNSYTGEGQYIAFKAAVTEPYDYYYLYIDNIEVSVLPSCFVPSGLEASNIGVDYAELTWEPYGDETAWQVRYSTDKNNWTLIPVTDNPYTSLEGLLANSLYYVQVRASCGTEDFSAWSATISFHTECGTYQAVPYYENFDNYPSDQDLPSCWTRLNTSPNEGYPEIGYASAGHAIFYSGGQLNPNSLYFYMGYSTSENAQYGILPKIQDINNLQMRFDAKGSDDTYYDYYSSCFQVGVMTDPEDESTFAMIFDEQENFHSELRSYTVSFDNYQGNEGYIAIKVYGETSRLKYLLIDNIAVEYRRAEFSEGWNWWAPTVVMSVQDVQSGLGINYVDIKAQNTNLVPTDNLIIGKMYMVQTNADCFMNLNGTPASSVEIEIEEGANWFGFIGVETTVTDAFEDFEPVAGDKVISQNEGFAIYTVVDGVGSWQGTLTTLVPGKGYVYVSNANETKTLELGQ